MLNPKFECNVSLPFLSTALSVTGKPASRSSKLRHALNLRAANSGQRNVEHTSRIQPHRLDEFFLLRSNHQV